MPLYHYQLGIPQQVRAQIKPLFGLRYSPHAREEAYCDRYGHVRELPRHFLPRVARVIEAETDASGALVKVLARQPYDKNDDVVFAVNVPDKVVKTVWRNSRKDTHRTLDASKYDKP
jgi:hypothetical protein